jgi:transglutaminase-like putative cysteine protease
MIRLWVTLTLFATQVANAAEQYRLTHRTTYNYDRNVSLSEQIVRLIPAHSAEPAVSEFSFSVLPANASALILPLADGNRVGRVRIGHKTDLFSYTISFVFTPDANKQKPDTSVPSGPDFLSFSDGPLLKKFVSGIEGSRKDLRLIANETCRNVYSTVEYSSREEQGIWPPEETLTKRRGACRDMVVLLMHALRSMDIQTRYVSGYLVLPGKTGESGVDFHAWCEAFIPNEGWLALDPTAGTEAGCYHIPLFRDPIPEKAAGLSGSVDECQVTLSFDMQAEPVDAAGRIETATSAPSSTPTAAHP